MATKKATKTVKKTTVKKPVAAKKTTKAAATITASSIITNISKTFKAAKKPSIGSLVAEFVGTFLLVASIFSVQGQPLFVAFALIGIVLIIAGVSSAHINPIVTIGAWVTRKMCSLCAIGFLAAQAIGATAAFLTISAFLENTKAATIEGLGSAPAMFHAATITPGKEMVILFAELLGAFIIALGVAKAIKSAKAVYAITYGLATLIALIIIGSITSLLLTESATSLTFLNPAMAIAADAIKWDVWPIAIYIVAPIVGGIAGFALNDLLSADTCDCADGKCTCK
ncbi:MAG: aquaporin [Candidatus Saccharibacteria bacterium]